MKIKLKSEQQIIDDDEITVWILDKGNGTIIININKLFNDTINECDWLDDGHQFLQVMYSDWDDNELFAIVNTNGEIIRNGIRSVEDFLEKQNLFIVEMSGVGMGDEASEYGISKDDWKMAVINKNGDFVVPPEFNDIWFDEDENLFYADDKHKFTIDGKELN